MRRREFISLLGGAAAASCVSWPLAARAQQPDRVRRIGALMNLAENDPEAQARVKAFQQGLQGLGWTEGRNVRIDYRWAGAGAGRYQGYAVELVALVPDLIVANGGPALAAVHQATRTIPIVFVQVPDPVGGGFVASLARPGGNASGFTSFEYRMSGKWLEAVKDIAPRVTRAAVILDRQTTAGLAHFGAIQALAPSLGVQLTLVGVREAAEIDPAIDSFAREPNGGLIVLPGPTNAFHRERIIALAARHRLPAVYPYRYFAAGGGLMSYGLDVFDQYRRAASYVDRILKGTTPADLPVQAPEKFELVINLKTAKALGLEVPATVLARADEVIE